MQFELIHGKTRKDAKGTERRPIIGVRIDMESLQPVPQAVKDARIKLDSALARQEAILIEAGVESPEGLALLGSETAKDAFAVHVKAERAAERILAPVLGASALALALQGFGPHSGLMTKALRRAVRGAWLLDESEDA